MARTKNSLQYELRERALADISDNDTAKSYRRSIRDFAGWARSQGIKDFRVINSKVIQEYEQYLEALPQNYTAATIHTKLAPVCKACGVSMRDIRKPKRTSGKIVRGRDERSRGAAELEQDKYKRLVNLQQAVGIRRAELARLEGRDWDGRYIHVRGGKGGKDTMQFVLPADRATVQAIFDGIGPKEHVFSKEEMQNHINLHTLRAEHARKCYTYYNNILERRPEQADALRKSLISRWERGNEKLQKTDPAKYARQRSRFAADLNKQTPYVLRGENKQKAERAGVPVEYNRLALMAVSVMHLSHWRLDVTVTNYLIP